MRIILFVLFQLIALPNSAQTTISDMFEKGIQEFVKYYSGKSQDVSKDAFDTRIYSNAFPFELYRNKLVGLKKDFAHYTYYSELTLKHRRNYILLGRCIFPSKDTVCVRFMTGMFNTDGWILDGTGYYTYFVYNNSTNTWQFSDFLIGNHAYFKDHTWKPRSLIAETIKAFQKDYPIYEKSIDKKKDDDYYYYRPLYLGDFTCEYDIDSIEKHMEVFPQGKWIKKSRKQHVTIVGLPNITMLDKMIKVDLYFNSFKKLKKIKYEDLYKHCYSAYFTFNHDCHDWILSRTNVETVK